MPRTNPEPRNLTPNNFEPLRPSNPEHRKLRPEAKFEVISGRQSPTIEPMQETGTTRYRFTLRLMKGKERGIPNNKQGVALSRVL